MASFWSRLHALAGELTSKKQDAKSSTETTPSKAKDTQAEPTPTLNEAVDAILSQQRSVQLKKHFYDISSSQYVSEREIRMWSGTFNVNGTLPSPEDDLAEWLMHPGDRWPERDGDMATWEGPDVLVVGFQEINPLDFRNVMVGGGLQNIEAWEATIECVLNRTQLPKFYASTKEAMDGLDAFTGQARPNMLSAAFGLSPRTLGMGVPADENKYVQVCSKLMVGIYLTVWARAPVAQNISSVQTGEVKSGAMGYLGNKGCVMARMRIYDTPICAIVVHLASGEAAGDDIRRTADFAELERLAVFPQGPALSRHVSLLHRDTHWRRTPVAVEQENVIILGDLNYRLYMPLAQVQAHLKAQRFDRLLARDQLLREMEKGTVFKRWKEGVVTFPPTFKYIKGTNAYVGDSAPESSASQAEQNPWREKNLASSRESSMTVGSNALNSDIANSSNLLSPALENQLNTATTEIPSLLGPDESAESRAKMLEERAFKPVSRTTSMPAVAVSITPKGQKVRTPAWTDRILWKSDMGQMHQMSYARAEATLSDHKPVMATFLLHASEVDRAKVGACVDTARRLCDVDINQQHPKCSLDENLVSVGNLPYGTSTTCSVTLTNTGEVPSSYSFMPLTGQRSPAPRLYNSSTRHHQSCAPPWLTVTPCRGVLAVQEQIVIQLTAAVAAGELDDAYVAEDLAKNGCDLDTILTLRIEGGADHFVVLSGTFIPSCFGLTMATLSELPRPLAMDPAEVRDPDAEPCDTEPTLSSMSGPEYTIASSLPFPSYWTSLPWELRRLLHYLARDECLLAERIFSDSYQMVRASTVVEGASPRGDAESELPSVIAVRIAIDAGHPISPDTGPHDVAAALLSYFRALPRPLIPESISQTCTEEVPPVTTAASALKVELMPVEWAAMCSVLHLIKLVLLPEATASNNHTPDSMAACFAEAWFPPVDMESLEVDEGAHTPDGGIDFREMIAQASGISQRRSEFLQMFLGPRT